MITGGIVVASNVYYGICTTAGDTQNKQVQLVNVSSELEGFHLQKGDTTRCRIKTYRRNLLY